MADDIANREKRHADVIRKRRAMFGLKPDKPKKAKFVALSPHQSKPKLSPKKSQKQFKARSVNKSQVDALEQKSNQDKVKQQVESTCKNRKIEIKKI